LLEAEAIALETMERQRIIPVLIALLEYEWLSGETVIKAEQIDRITGTLDQSIYTIEKNEFAFWLRKARNQQLPLHETYEGYEVNNEKYRQAAVLWEQLNSHYMQALLLFEGDDDDKREAITIIQRLGATAAYEKLKAEMRTAGIKNIPRGARKTTQSNPAQLTDRELDILQLLNHDLQNKEIAARLFISAKTVDHHISSILYKLEVNSRKKAVREAIRLEIIK
jgi:DNA-binding CsgD family transcriptional regulator